MCEGWAVTVTNANSPEAKINYYRSGYIERRSLAPLAGTSHEWIKEFIPSSRAIVRPKRHARARMLWIRAHKQIVQDEMESVELNDWMIFDFFCVRVFLINWSRYTCGAATCAALLVHIGQNENRISRTNRCVVMCRQVTFRQNRWPWEFDKNTDLNA